MLYSNVNDILLMYNDKIKNLFNDKLVRVILYGSYARGDYKEDSDIDIMILVNVEPDEVSIYADKIYDLTYDFEMDYDI